jgi:hypothetical protein
MPPPPRHSLLRFAIASLNDSDVSDMMFKTSQPFDFDCSHEGSIMLWQFTNDPIIVLMGAIS